MKATSKAFYYGLLLATNAAIAIAGICTDNMVAAVAGSIGATASFWGIVDLIDESGCI